MHTHIQRFNGFIHFFVAQNKENQIGTFCISDLFQASSHLPVDSFPPACTSLGENFRLHIHLQHFLKVPIQIPSRIISSLHSDVLPFIPALYSCQLSPVLGKRRKRISSAFALLGHFTEVVSPYRLGAPPRQLSVNPAAHQDTRATYLLSCYFQPWPHLNDLRTRNKFLHNISNQKRSEVCYNGDRSQKAHHTSRIGADIVVFI